MIKEAVARRYSRALFGAAQARQLIDRVAEDLEGIERLLREEPRLGGLLISPQVAAEEKRALLETLLRGRAHPLVLELLGLLLEKKRMTVVQQVIEGYRELVEEHRGIVRAQVTTAVPMPDALRERLLAALERRSGKKILIEPAVDPRVIGGVMVRMGDRIIDRSVQRAFKEMRENLLEVPVYE